MLCVVGGNLEKKRKGEGGRFTESSKKKGGKRSDSTGDHKNRKGLPHSSRERTRQGFSHCWWPGRAASEEGMEYGGGRCSEKKSLKNSEKGETSLLIGKRQTFRV